MEMRRSGLQYYRLNEMISKVKDKQDEIMDGTIEEPVLARRKLIWYVKLRQIPMCPSKK